MIIAPEIISPKSNSSVKRWLEVSLQSRVQLDKPGTIFLNGEDFNTLKIQFIALGLINYESDDIWWLTQKGQHTLMQLGTVKNSTR